MGDCSPSQVRIIGRLPAVESSRVRQREHRRLKWLDIASIPPKLRGIWRPHEPKPFGPALNHLFAIPRTRWRWHRLHNSPAFIHAASDREGSERFRSKARGPWATIQPRRCPRVLCIGWLSVARGQDDASSVQVDAFPVFTVSADQKQMASIFDPYRPS